MVAFFGLGGSNSGTGAGEFAKVNGESIPQTKLGFALDQERQQFQQSQGLTQIPDFYQQILEARTREKLINRALMTQRVDEFGIKATDAELSEVIKQNFSNNGKFDPDFYLNKYRPYYQQSTGIDYETDLRKDLSLQKIFDQLNSTIEMVTEAEIEKWYKFNNTKLSFEVIRVPKKKLKDLETLSENAKEDGSTEPVETEVEDPNAKTLATQLLEEWKKGADMEKLAKDKGVVLRPTGFFQTTYLKIIMDGDSTFEDQKTLALLNKDNPFPKTVLENDKNFYVIKFKDQQLPDESKKETELQREKGMRLNAYLGAVQSAWATHLRKDADISRAQTQ